MAGSGHAGQVSIFEVKDVSEIDPIQHVKAYLARVNPSIQVLEFNESTRSAELAARVVGVETGAVAKSKQESPGQLRSGDSRSYALGKTNQCLNPCMGLYLFSRLEFDTTDTELRAIAAPAIIGARYPKAAIGMPRVL